MKCPNVVDVLDWACLAPEAANCDGTAQRRNGDAPKAVGCTIEEIKLKEKRKRKREKDSLANAK